MSWNAVRFHKMISASVTQKKNQQHRKCLKTLSGFEKNWQWLIWELKESTLTGQLNQIIWFTKNTHHSIHVSSQNPVKKTKNSNILHSTLKYHELFLIYCIIIWNFNINTLLKCVNKFGQIKKKRETSVCVDIKMLIL